METEQLASPIGTTVKPAEAKTRLRQLRDAAKATTEDLGLPPEAAPAVLRATHGKLANEMPPQEGTPAGDKPAGSAR